MASRYGRSVAVLGLALGVLLAGSVRGGTVGAQAEDAGPDGAAARCRLRKLSGTWGYRVNGILMAPLMPGNTAAVGSLELGRDGTFNGSDVLVFNDLVVPRQIQGSVAIQPDCTGTAQFNDSLGQTINVSLVVVDRRNEIFFVQTDAGAIVTGVMRRR